MVFRFVVDCSGQERVEVVLDRLVTARGYDRGEQQLRPLPGNRHQHNLE